jgi:hypothetical protein
MRQGAAYEGQRVTLVGYFRGQDLLNEVVLDAPTDRFRDWVVKDSEGAIYVSYQRLLPFSPTSHEVWRVVRVSGDVKRHPNGMPYIVPDDVQWEGLKEDYDVLPASCIVAIHQFGGEAGVDHHVYWYTTRTLGINDSSASWQGVAKLTRGDLNDLERTFNASRFFKLPATVGTECEGCIRYHIAAVNEKKNEPHFVTLYQGSVPRKLQAFIDQVIAKTAKAQSVQ